jgi:hypothetical protein
MGREATAPSSGVATPNATLFLPLTAVVSPGSNMALPVTEVPTYSTAAGEQVAIPPPRVTLSSGETTTAIFWPDQPGAFTNTALEYQREVVATFAAEGEQVLYFELGERRCPSSSASNGLIIENPGRGGEVPELMFVYEAARWRLQEPGPLVDSIRLAWSEASMAPETPFWLTLNPGRAMLGLFYPGGEEGVVLGAPVFEDGDELRLEILVDAGCSLEVTNLRRVGNSP